MRVQCLSTYPDDSLLAMLGPGVNPNRRYYGLTLYNQYVVLGLTFMADVRMSEIGPFVEVRSDEDDALQAPLGLFNIIDPRVSRYWEVRSQADQSVTLWPASFYGDPYYHDHLSEGVAEIVEDFKRVCAMLKGEYPPNPESYLSDAERETLHAFLNSYWPVGAQDDDASMKAIAEQTTQDERARYARLLQRLVDSPEPLRRKAEFIRQCTWHYFTPSPESPIVWLASIVMRLQQKTA